MVTLAGSRPVSRIGASLLQRAGLGQFVTHSEEEYLVCALHHARNLPELEEIRLGMRDRLAANLEASAKGIARAVEAAYRTAWREWCSARQ